MRLLDEATYVNTINVTDQVGIDVDHLQLRRRPSKPIGRVFEQQSERITIAGDRVRARFQLCSEALGEEALQVDGKRMRLHRAPPFFGSFFARERSARFEASCSSSGTASMYQ